MNLLKAQDSKSSLLTNSDNVAQFDKISGVANTSKDIEQMAHLLSMAKLELQQLNALLEKDLPQSGIEKINENIAKMPFNILDVESNFKRLQNQPEELRVKVEQLTQRYKEFNSFKGTEEEKVKLYNQLKTEISATTKEIQSLVKAQGQQVLDTDISKFNSRMTTWANQNTKAAKIYADDLSRIQRELKGADKLKFNNLTKEFQAVQRRAEAMGVTGRTAFQTIFDNFRKFSSWFAIGGVTAGSVRTIKRIIENVVELDTSIVELQKVSDLTGDSLERFVDKAYNLGEQVARTGKEVIDATTVFKRAGYTIEESLDLAKASLVMTNVGDGIKNVEVASSALIATLKGFKLSDSDAMTVIDMINSTSNQAAIDFENITEGLRRVSGTLSQTGTSIQETIGLLTGGFSSLRDIEMVSSGLIMISQRLRGIGEDGEAIEGLAPKLKNAFKEIANIDIENKDGGLRSTFDILKDLVKVFPTLTDKQRQYLGELVAGNRQVKVLNAIVSGWGDVEQAVDSAVNSQGSALKENEKVLNSVSGKINEFKSAFEELSRTTVSSDSLKFFIELGTLLLKTTNSMGGLTTAVVVLSGAFLTFKVLLPLLIKDMSALLLTEAGVTATTLKQIVAQTGLNGAYALGSTVLKGYIATLKSFLLTNPVGWIILATGALIGLNSVIKASQKSFIEVQAEYDELKSKIETVNTELKTVGDRIDQLNNKDTLTIVEQEELKKLQDTNDALERQIALLKTQSEFTNKEYASKLYQEFLSDYAPTNMLGQSITQDAALSIWESSIKLDISRYKELEKVKENNILLTKSEQKEYDKLGKKLSDTAVDVQEYFEKYPLEDDIKKYWETQYEAINKALNPEVYRKQELESLVDYIYKEEMAKHGKLDESIIGSNTYYHQLINNAGLSMQAVLEHFKAIKEEAKNTADEVDNIFSLYTSEIDDYQKSVKAIGDALSKLDKISPTEIIDLMQQFPELAEYGYTGSEGINVLEGALQKLLQRLFDTLPETLKSNDAFIAIYNETMNAAKGVETLSSALSKMNDSGKFLDDVKAEFKELGYISSDTLAKISSKSPELETLVA
ncbi:MAG TPA: phage tail tape measure protein, partial [Bacteroidales bacterium]|nr:phage tail tape measure protein [Bacteroidales bacterium]